MKTVHVLILAAAILGAALILKPTLVEQTSQAGLEERERLERFMREGVREERGKQCAASIGLTLETLDRADPKQLDAWQQLSILAHNLIRSFQLDTLAPPKPRSRKRTYTYLIRSMRTLRFLLVVRAGRLTRLGGRHVLRLFHNPATEALYGAISHRLAA